MPEERTVKTVNPVETLNWFAEVKEIGLEDIFFFWDETYCGKTVV